MKILLSQNPKQTSALAEKISKRLKLPAVIALWGDLGSGKTQFVKGLALGLKIKKPVTSPTFIVARNYSFKKRGKTYKLYHFDLYRLKRLAEIANFGLDEILLDPKSLIVVEWPKIIKNILPRRTHQLFFTHGKTEKERAIKYPASLA